MIRIGRRISPDRALPRAPREDRIDLWRYIADIPRTETTLLARAHVDNRYTEHRALFDSCRRVPNAASRPREEMDEIRRWEVSNENSLALLVDSPSWTPQHDSRGNGIRWRNGHYKTRSLRGDTTLIGAAMFEEPLTLGTAAGFACVVCTFALLTAPPRPA